MRVLIVPSIGGPGILYYRCWVQALACPDVEWESFDVPQWARGGILDIGASGWLDKALARRYDAIYAPYCSNLERMLSVKVLKDKLGVPVVVDCDDLFTHLDETNQSFHIGHEASDCRRAWDGYFALADVLTTTTPTLAAALPVPRGTPVRIVPNFVRPDDYDADRRPHDDVRIMFSGASGGHWREFEFLTPVLREIMAAYPQTKMVINGFLPADWLDIPRVYALRWCDVPAYFRLLRHVAPDIGLAPLVPTPFNAGKSGIKYYEYAMAGAAGIYADLDPYSEVRPGVTGLVVPPDPDAWRDALGRLIENAALRGIIRDNARADVLAHHTGPSALKPVIASLCGNMAAVEG